RLEAARRTADQKARIETRLTTLETEAQAASERAREARAAAAAAEDGRDAVRREDHVAALTSNLNTGDPCPVCARPLVEHREGAPAREPRLADSDEEAQGPRRDADRATAQTATTQAHLAAAGNDLAEATNALQAALGDERDLAGLETMVAVAS